MKKHPRKLRRKGLPTKAPLAGNVRPRSEELAADRPHDQGRRSKPFRDFLAGVALSVLLAILSLVFEDTSFGKDFRWITFRLLQRQLTADSRLPIRVVDIGDLPPEQTRVTSRGKLKDLLKALAKQDPKVIGIDIDFSPEVDSQTQKETFIEPGDPKFFKFCKYCLKNDRGRKIPVYLGISRTEKLPPNQWLGVPEFQDLAAALLVPKYADKVLESLADAEQKGAAADPARTMSGALASHYSQVEKKKICPLLQRSSDNEFLVDYSLLQRLRDTRIKISRESFANLDLLNALVSDRGIKDQMVLIGDIDNATDAFTSPVSGTEATTPGVLILASAASTLAVQPLYQFREPWIKGADLGLAMLLLFIIYLMRVRFEERFQEDRLLLFLVILAVAATVGAGFYAAHQRIFWDGFLLVAAALALHPFADGISKIVWQGVPGWLQTSKEK